MSKTLACAAIVAAAFAVPAVAGAATPDPVGAPGCVGNIVATFNHNSGLGDKDSRGPGFFFRNGATVKAAIADARSICG